MEEPYYMCDRDFNVRYANIQADSRIIAHLPKLRHLEKMGACAVIMAFGPTAYRLVAVR
jgi:3-phosphoglycerate kinase